MNGGENMKCPFCFNDESKVVDSRSTDDNTTIRRRRECTKCNKRYTTYEKIEDIPVLVIKRDLAREPINQMLTDVARFYGFDCPIELNWGRAGANTSTENQELLADYQAGTLPLRRYLKKRWSDLSEEEVEAWAQEIEEEQKKQQVNFGEFYPEGVNNEDSEQTAEQASDNIRGSGSANPFNS